jgi:hypothetical protein
VDRPDARDHPNVGPRHLAELGDLAEPAHSHLDDGDLGLGLEPAERERKADLVVLAALGDHGGSMRRAERAENVLRGGLRRRAGDGHDPRRASLADGASEGGERAEGVFGEESRSRSLAEGVVRELGSLADGDEEVAVLHQARVDRHAADLVRPGRRFEPPGRERRDLVEREPDHAAARLRRRASRATSRSSNGIVWSASSWPCS